MSAVSRRSSCADGAAAADGGDGLRRESRADAAERRKLRKELSGSHFNSTKQLQAMELRALEDDARERREEEEATARERREEEERRAAEATRRREEEEARLEELARAATMPTAGSAQRRVASFERRLSAGGSTLPPLRRGRSECRKTIHIMSSEV